MKHTLYHRGHLYPCTRPGVEYVLEDGRRFIGYETRNHINGKVYVRLVRWVD